MKKRICSLLLICSMLAGLLPQIVLPQAAAADTAAGGGSGYCSSKRRLWSAHGRKNGHKRHSHTS